MREKICDEELKEHNTKSYSYLSKIELLKIH